MDEIKNPAKFHCPRGSFSFCYNETDRYITDRGSSRCNLCGGGHAPAEDPEFWKGVADRFRKKKENLKDRVDT